MSPPGRPRPGRERAAVPPCPGGWAEARQRATSVTAERPESRPSRLCPDRDPWRPRAAAEVQPRALPAAAGGGAGANRPRTRGPRDPDPRTDRLSSIWPKPLSRAVSRQRDTGYPRGSRPPQGSPPSSRKPGPSGLCPRQPPTAGDLRGRREQRAEGRCPTGEPGPQTHPLARSRALGRPAGRAPAPGRAQAVALTGRHPAERLPPRHPAHAVGHVQPSAHPVLHPAVPGVHGVSAPCRGSATLACCVSRRSGRPQGGGWQSGPGLGGGSEPTLAASGVLSPAPLGGGWGCALPRASEAGHYLLCLGQGCRTGTKVWEREKEGHRLLGCPRPALPTHTQSSRAGGST